MFSPTFTQALSPFSYLLNVIHDDLQLCAPEHDHAHGYAIHRYKEESADVDADHLVEVPQLIARRLQRSYWHPAENGVSR